MTQLSMSITRRSLRLGRLAKTFAASPAHPAGGPPATTLHRQPISSQDAASFAKHDFKQ
ncbi:MULTISPECIES: hypothetical protein [unclassified Bradyrhizobium]